ncbi:uncharacterized protein FIBRA_04916 [Fibroporia radiculosa]|uniref:Mid2 domain-containing protein n=1 Tax=Fibroporia radiculosa TaxID=599839 RepID=J4GQ22_9APHY|nr:uncharacterized protein FIBRA_04916 [Fibroporia radiculosa]CCM02805.1 predicted protein [Fibroporia radiculosa]
MLGPFLYHLLRSTVIFALLKNVSSVSMNATIDDENGDSVTGAKPIYSGTNWNYGPGCPGCKAQPDIDDTFDRSWHDFTAHPTDTGPHTITLTFTGTAIWIYCVIPNYIEGVTTLTNVSINLDGKDVDLYTHMPLEDTTEMYYNVSIYTNTDLANAMHTVVLMPTYEVNASIILFDWAQYTYEEDPPSTQPQSATPTPPSTPATPASPSAQPQSATATPSSAITQSNPSSTSNIDMPSKGSTGAFVSRPQSSPTGISTSNARLPTQSPSNGSPNSPTSSATSSRVNITGIAVGVVVGIVSLVILVAVFLCWRRKGRNRAKGVFTEPFTEPSSRLPHIDSSATLLRVEESPHKSSMPEVEQELPHTDPRGIRHSTLPPSNITPAAQSADASRMPYIAGADDNGMVDMILRRQVANLQLEMERLREVAAITPPPAYQRE